MLCTAPEAELGRVTGRPESYRRASFRVRLQPEQVELAGETRRYRQIEMPVGDLGQHAAARGALQEALLQQIGLDDLFEDVALIAERRRHRLDADSAAAVMLGDRAEVAAVHRIEAAMIDFERSEEHTSELQSRLHLVCRL